MGPLRGLLAPVQHLVGVVAQVPGFTGMPRNLPVVQRMRSASVAAFDNHQSREPKEPKIELMDQVVLFAEDVNEADSALENGANRAVVQPAVVKEEPEVELDEEEESAEQASSGSESID